MLANDILLDSFGRVKEVVHQVVTGLSEDDLAFRPAGLANSIAWLVWHIARIQDDQIADVAHTTQVWHQGWLDKFALPFDRDATGYGQSAEEVALVKASAELLLGYYDAVHDATVAYLQNITEADYQKVVDTRWNPPVTLAVRLVSTLDDNLQHAGQAAYARGLLSAK